MLALKKKSIMLCNDVTNPARTQKDADLETQVEMSKEVPQSKVIYY